MKTKIIIEIETDFNKLKSDDGKKLDNSDKNRIEKVFDNIMHRFIEDYIIDEEMELQELVLQELCEEEGIDNVGTYSDLGNISFKIIKEEEEK